MHGQLLLHIHCIHAISAPTTCIDVVHDRTCTFPASGALAALRFLGCSSFFAAGAAFFLAGGAFSSSCSSSSSSSASSSSSTASSPFFAAFFPPFLGAALPFLAFFFFSACSNSPDGWIFLHTRQATSQNVLPASWIATSAQH